MKDDTNSMLMERPVIQSFSSILKKAVFIGLLVGGICTLIGFTFFNIGIDSTLPSFSEIIDFFSYCFFSVIIWIGKKIIHLDSTIFDAAWFYLSIILISTTAYATLNTGKELKKAESFIENMINRDMNVRAYWYNLSDKDRKYPKDRKFKTFAITLFFSLMAIILLFDISMKYVFSSSFMFDLMARDFIDFTKGLGFTVIDAQVAISDAVHFMILSNVSLMMLMVSTNLIKNINYNVDHIIEYAKSLQ